MAGFNFETMRKKIIIGNLQKDCTIGDLKEFFKPVLEKIKVDILFAVDKKGKSKGFAVVEVPITFVEKFLNFNDSYLKDQKIKVSLSDGMKFPKSTKWQTTTKGVFTSDAVQASVFSPPEESKTDMWGPVESQYDIIDGAVYLMNPRLKYDIEGVIERAVQCGVEKMVVIGTTVYESQEAISLCRLFSGILYCTAGLTPGEAQFWTDETTVQLEKIASCPECVAIGECGFDLSTDTLIATCDQQLIAFEGQIQLACRLQKPLVVTERKAHSEVVALLSKYKDQLPQVVINCVPLSEEDLTDYIANGFYIYVHGQGWIGFKLPLCLWLSETKVQVDKLLIASLSPFYPLKSGKWRYEDAKYLTFTSGVNRLKLPQKRRNEPFALPCLLELIASSLCTEPNILSKQLRQNSLNFFKLGEYHGDTKKDEKKNKQSHCVETKKAETKMVEYFVFFSAAAVACLAITAAFLLTLT